jgi:hypothetical protein
MKTLRQAFVTAAVAGLLAALGAAAAEVPFSLVGRWEGATVVHPAEVEVDFVLQVAEGTTDHFRGTISFPPQGPKEYPLDSLVFEGNHVSFVTTDEAGVASMFDGELQPDQRVTGKVKVREKSYPFVMARRSAGPSSPEVAVRALSADGKELKELFNQDSGKARLVMIFSPTCGVCRMGAGLVQRYVLDTIDDPKVRIYVVWEAIDKGDSEQEAAKAAAFLPDERVTHFWSTDRFTGRAFQAALGLEGAPAWDVILLFPADLRWQPGSVPQPSDFMHNLPQRLPKEKTLNGATLAQKVKSILVSLPEVKAAARR